MRSNQQPAGAKYLRIFPGVIRYTNLVRNVTITLPDEIVDALASSGRDLSRAALEALTLEAYLQRRLTGAQVRKLLGFEAPMELDAFLKEHAVELEYSLEDLERDRETHRRLGL